MIMTLRHLKLWKRRASSTSRPANEALTGGPGEQAAGAPPLAAAAGDSMFRSPSSDSGYSDVPTALSRKQKQNQAAGDARPGKLHSKSTSALNSHSAAEQAPGVAECGACGGVGEVGVVVTRPDPPPHIDLNPNVVILQAGCDKPIAKPRLVEAPKPPQRGVAQYRFAGVPNDRRQKMMTSSSSRGCFVLSPTQVTASGRLFEVASPTAGGRGGEMVSVEAFLEFVRRRDVESMRYALKDAHYDIDSQDVDGKTALHVALVHGIVDNDMDLVRLLINYGANVNIKDETAQRESCLHVALRLGHVEAVQLVLESPTFDIVRCDALQKNRMLPECCTIDDVYKPLPADSDCTLTKRRSFGDQYMLFARQDTNDYMENNFPSAREPIRDLIVVQDEHLPPLSHVIRRIDVQTLTTLYLVDCRPNLDDECFSALQLRTLVLSQTHLRSLPHSLFAMSSSLETLKVDHNSLAELPVDVGRLCALRVLSCDAQRPRLRSLPINALSRLARLEVLSFADNRITDIAWIPGSLPRLRTLHCDRNAIGRLPDALGDLQRLESLDVSHNRIDRIPAAMAPLIRRLFRFEYFNLTLRPRQIRRCRSRLLAHLDLETFLATLHVTAAEHSSTATLPIAFAGGATVSGGPSSVPYASTASSVSQRGIEQVADHHQRPTVRDITVAVVGETHSGKTSLVAALRDEIGISRAPETRPPMSGSQSQQQTSGSSSASQHGGPGRASHSSAGGFEIHQFEMRSTFVSAGDVIGGGANGSCHVVALVLGNEVLDSFSQQVSIDLFILVVDLTALELHNGSHHLFARHVARLQMWLQALYELAADTPVLIVGTHAEQVRSMSFADIWRILDELLDQSRTHHSRRFNSLESRHPTCLLCCPRSLAFRQPHSAKAGRPPPAPPSSSAPGGGVFQSSSSTGAAAASSAAASSGPGSFSTSSLLAPPTVAGFVDLSFPHYHPRMTHHQYHHHLQYVSASHRSGAGAYSTSGGDTPPNATPQMQAMTSTLMNGHHHVTGGIDPSPPGSTSGGSTYGGVGSRGSGGFRFPHVVGYYEVDSRKPFPKDSKLKSNLGIDQLKAAIIRLSAYGMASVSDGYGCGGNGSGSIAGQVAVPSCWIAFIRHVSAIREQTPFVPFISYDEVVSIARSFEIAPSEVTLMLQYFHRRGRLVFFADDPLLSRLVVVSPSWFVQTIGRAVDSFDRSLVDGGHMLQFLVDRELDRQLQKAICPTTSSSSAQWLLSALMRLDLCLPVGECSSLMQPSTGCGNQSMMGCCSPGYGSSAGITSRLFVFPGLLESGSPSQDVWPDVPEWDEKQITCDFRIREIKPGMFADFMRRLNDQGRRLLEIVPDPVPVFLSHHVVFFTAIDLGGCDDCRAVRRRLKYMGIGNSTSGGSGGPSSSCHHRLADGGGSATGAGRRGPGTMGGSSGSMAGGFGAQPGSEDSSAVGCGGYSSGIGYGMMSAAGDCSMDDDLLDDVMHKVHIQLHSGLDAIRIQVRGVNPCCTMKAVLNFLELYLDDIPDDYYSSISSSTPGGGGCWTSADASTTSSDRASLNSLLAASAASPSGSGSDRGPTVGGSGHNVDEEPTTSGPESGASGTAEQQRQFFLLCPKCVLLRHARPERIQYQAMTARRKAICSRWHNLGSWSRAATGDYRYSTIELHQHLQSGLSSLPDYEHPRLVVVLPPSQPVSGREWYVFNRLRLLEGFEAHFLCENPAYWHMIEDSGYRLSRPQSVPGSRRRGGGGAGGASEHIAALLSLALPMVQVVQGVNEHSQTCRLVAPVVAELVRTYDYLRAVDAHLLNDPYAWLTKNKDRVVAMLTKVLANASDGLPDLYFKAGSSISPDSVFQAPSRASRSELARFLRVEASSGRFGALRPIYIGREIRWVCDAHYEELRSIPSK